MTTSKVKITIEITHPDGAKELIQTATMQLPRDDPFFHSTDETTPAFTYGVRDSNEDFSDKFVFIPTERRFYINAVLAKHPDDKGDHLYTLVKTLAPTNTVVASVNLRGELVIELDITEEKACEILTEYNDRHFLFLQVV